MRFAITIAGVLWLTTSAARSQDLHRDALLPALERYVINAFIAAGKTKETPLMPHWGTDAILPIAAQQAAAILQSGVADAIRVQGHACASVDANSIRQLPDDSLELTCNQGHAAYHLTPASGETRVRR